MPPADAEVTVPGGFDVVAVGVQVKEVTGAGVPADAAAVPLAQILTADFSGPCHISDVLTEAVTQEELHLAAVVLWKQDEEFRT